VARLPVESTGFIDDRSAVAALVARPEPERRTGARRRAERFTWAEAAAGMLRVLGASAG
jgi:hypothetical protein